jgi:hypothetical protein
MASNSIYRLYAEKLGNSDVTKFIGKFGEIFYDPIIPILHLSDGHTLGGIEIPTGYINIPQVVMSNNYVCILSDSGKHILHPTTDTTARTLTIPASTNVNFDLGSTITVINQNAAGTLTIICGDTMRLAGSGITGNRTLTANGMCTAIKLSATEWIISGTNLT